MIALTSWLDADIGRQHWIKYLTDERDFRVCKKKTSTNTENKVIAQNKNAGIDLLMCTYHCIFHWNLFFFTIVISPLIRTDELNFILL